MTPGLTPQAVYAADDGQSKDQERWLSDTEKAYVDKMRQAYATTRGAIGSLQVCIWKAELAAQGDKEWYATFNGNLATLRTVSKVFCNEKAPESMKTMDKAHANLCELCGRVTGAAGLVTGVFTADAILALDSVNRDLENIEVGLSVCEGMLNNYIAKIAKEGEEQAEVAEEAWEYFFGEDCFIATAAYGTPATEQIDILRQFRDESLSQHTAGKTFVAVYYELSPPIAEFISQHEVVRTVVREGFVDPAVAVVELTKGWWGE